MADSYVGVFEFGCIVHTGNGSFSLGHDAVIVNVVGQQALLYGACLGKYGKGCVLWCFGGGITEMRFGLLLDYIVFFQFDRMLMRWRVCM